MEKSGSFSFDWLFRLPSGRQGSWLRRISLLLLYLLGAGVWVFFLNRGRIGFDLHDWTQEGPRLYFLRESLLSGQFPLHISSPLFAGERFLSIPDTLFSPQILLLRVLEPGPFVLANLLIMYTIGYTGILLLSIRRSWSLLVTAAVFMLFNFNGQLTAQLAVGHIMWMTAFLLPFLVLLIYDALEGGPLWAWVLRFSILMLVFFLQGGFHFVTWSLLFLILMALTVPAVRLRSLLGFAFSLLLCLPRILPTAVEMGGVRRQFISGFYSLADMLEALVVLRFPHEAAVEKYASLGWWEVDTYIGLVGFTLLAFGIWRTWKNLYSRSRPLLLPLFLFTLLSLGRLYQPVTMLPIPLFNAQRVTTRFLLLSLFFLVAISGDEAQRILDKELSPGLKVVAGGLLLVLGHDLLQHTRLWRVENMARLFDRTPVDISAQVLQLHDPPYLAALIGGAAAAVLGAAVLAYLARRESRVEVPQVRQ